MSPVEPWQHLITRDEVVRLHHLGIDRYGGGTKLPPSDGCVEQTLGGAWAAEQYLELDGGCEGLLFAAHVLVYLAKNHCFGNGNKRVAWLSMERILLELGLTLDLTESEATQLVNDIVTSKLDGQAVAMLIGEKAVESPAPDAGR